MYNNSKFNLLFFFLGKFIAPLNTCKSVKSIARKWSNQGRGAGSSKVVLPSITTWLF